LLMEELLPKDEGGGTLSTPRGTGVPGRPTWRATLRRAGTDMLEIVREKWRPYIALTSHKQHSDRHTAFGGDR
jgi:hypothetical protein